MSSDGEKDKTIQNMEAAKMDFGDIKKAADAAAMAVPAFINDKLLMVLENDQKRPSEESDSKSTDTLLGEKSAKMNATGAQKNSTDHVDNNNDNINDNGDNNTIDAKIGDDKAKEKLSKEADGKKCADKILESKKSVINEIKNDSVVGEEEKEEAKENLEKNQDKNKVNDTHKVESETVNKMDKNGGVDSKTDATDKDTDKEKDIKKDIKIDDQTKENSKECEDDNDDGVNEAAESDDEENVVALAEIDKINENINKTRVDGLQTLHAICFGSPGKNNVVKKNLRSFAGFEFEKHSTEYKKKFDAIKKVEIKALKHICDILSLERKGSKDDIVNRILQFLMEPDESLCVEPVEEEDEEIDDDDDEKEDLEQAEKEPIEDEKRKHKAPPSRQRSTSGRPRRATAGKKMSAYVDFSSSEESEHKVMPAKRRRNDDSESGSDYNPSANSDSEGGRGRKAAVAARGIRGRPARKCPKRDTDSEEESISEADSDVPKRKQRASTGGKRGRPAGTRGRGRGASSSSSRKRKDSDSEEEEELSEDEEEEEMTDLGSEQSEEEDKSKKSKKSHIPAKNNKANNKNRTSAKSAAGRPKKFKKESSDDVDDKDESDEDEPLNKKGKASFPTDEQIRAYVKEILDKANLEEITMKTVCKQVYAKYPDFDLTEKKDFIKATVKALIAA